MSKHSIGPLADEDEDFLISEYKTGRSIDSIARDMMRPSKFLYKKLESLGLVYPKGKGIIICRDCQIEVKAKTRQTKCCKDCADKRFKERLKVNREKYLATNPIALNKMRARTMANWWLVSGRLTRPERCELCNQIPSPLKNGQSGLRMDHYMGYEEKYWTTVKFVCIPCDSKQIINRNILNVNQ